MDIMPDDVGVRLHSLPVLYSSLSPRVHSVGLKRELVLVFVHIDAVAMSIDQGLASRYTFKVPIFLPVCLNHHRMIQFVLFTVVLRVIVIGVELIYVLAMELFDVLAMELLLIFVGVKIAPFGAAATHLGVVHFSLALLLVVEHEHALLQEETFLFASVFKELWL